MNILKGVVNFFTGGSSTAGKILDAGIRGIDALVYTDEEKAEMMKKLGDQWIETQKVLLGESSIRAVTRRILAIMVMASFTFLVLLAAGVYLINQEYAKFLLELAQSQFGLMALGIMTFYFGPYMIQKAFSAAKKTD